MDILYLLGALLIIIVLGYAYFLYVRASKEKGPTKIAGFSLSGLLVALIIALIVLYETGAIGMPEFMPERPSARMIQGMSGYVTGMMIDDPQAIDEFINVLKTKPELFEAVRAKMQ